MPTVWEEHGFRFGFYSLDVRSGERPHIPAVGSSGRTKVWLDTGELEYAKGLSAAVLLRVLRIVQERRDLMLSAWEEFIASRDTE